MNKTWMPIAAGILDIISGVFQLAVFAYLSYGTVYQHITTVGNNVGLAWLRVILIYTAPLTITGILAIVGGIYILQKKKSNLVYLGALAASIPLVLLVAVISWVYHPAWALFLPIGIGALFLSLRAEKEFKK